MQMSQNGKRGQTRQRSQDIEYRPSQSILITGATMYHYHTCSYITTPLSSQPRAHAVKSSRVVWKKFGKSIRRIRIKTGVYAHISSASGESLSSSSPNNFPLSHWCYAHLIYYFCISHTQVEFEIAVTETHTQPECECKRESRLNDKSVTKIDL